MRRTVSGDTVGYVVNRNINYTNVCNYGCRFCAFSKGRLGDSLRGPAYDLDREEIARRVREAWDRGATDVCMQGGIHPRYTGATYLSILGAANRAVSDIHIHAFSPLEIHQGATSLGLDVGDYLDRLRGGGLGSLPGTGVGRLILITSIEQTGHGHAGQRGRQVRILPPGTRLRDERRRIVRQYPCAHGFGQPPCPTLFPQAGD